MDGRSFCSRDGGMLSGVIKGLLSCPRRKEKLETNLSLIMLPNSPVHQGYLNQGIVIVCFGSLQIRYRPIRRKTVNRSIVT